MHHMTVCGFSARIVGAASCLLWHGFPISLQTLSINTTVSIKACDTHDINKIKPFLKGNNIVIDFPELILFIGV